MGQQQETFITQEDAEQEWQQVIRDTAWYKNEYGAHMSTKGRQSKNEYTSPEMLYDIDGEHYVKTSHEHPGKWYAVTPGASNIDLQSKQKYKEDFVDDDSSKESSDLSNMSRYQLISQLCKLGDISYYYKGPTPQSVKGCVLTLLRSSDEYDSIQEAANIG